MTGIPLFPAAQQAQIIRAHQRDLYHVSLLHEQAENTARSWLGSRTLTRWDKELELVVKLLYYSLTTGRATQTLGEEYTDIWQHSTTMPPSRLTRAALVLLPSLPAYMLSRMVNTAQVFPHSPWLTTLLRDLPFVLETLTELNLAVFYIRGVYYDVFKRFLGVRHISSLPENPHTRPPSYSLLGVLLTARLIYRLTLFVQSKRSNSALGDQKGKRAVQDSASRETYLDDRPVSQLLDSVDPESEPAKPAEDDARTMLDVASLPPTIRASRTCTLCLEERTDTCSTECGHLFCWSCIVGWGREKVSLFIQNAVTTPDSRLDLTGRMPIVSTEPEPYSLTADIQSMSYMVNRKVHGLQSDEQIDRTSGELYIYTTCCIRVMLSPLRRIRPNSLLGFASFTYTSAASSRTRFINSSKPIILPSIRISTLSYSHMTTFVR
ncbi:Pex12 amino terminal region-domain-containing protein [Lentinula aciculospora]|uniref:RING-type E3 ubiquitin transferase n=1 Tax=Lentinula aciculospora TaxID=153920 RepID=A0A9W9AN67_9AGAR|nr:Pex12 amino terminal region-domain-containing protein [Lentinula aciculospora]